MNYGGQAMQFIEPVWYEHSSPNQKAAWRKMMSYSEATYNELLNYGWHPQQAREVLPNSLKTEIDVTANAREWRHIFKLRCAKAAHPQMRALMIETRAEFQNRVPILFDDIK